MMTVLIMMLKFDDDADNFDDVDDENDISDNDKTDNDYLMMQLNQRNSAYNRCRFMVPSN